MNGTYFGNPEKPLFGVHHPVRQANRPTRALLICPPIGHEHHRSQWALRLLAQQLTREGFHVLNFDYAGVGESSNWIGGTKSLDCWIDDIHLAKDELISKSGCRRISIVGLRVGALLAAKAAETDLALDHLVLWEPVLSGSRYTQTQDEMHQQMLELWGCQTTDDDDEGVERLGYYYQRSLVAQLQAISLDQIRPICQRLSIVNSDFAVEADQRTICAASGREAAWGAMGDTPDWHQLTEIENLWLPSKAVSEVIQTLKSPLAADLKIFATPQIHLADPSHEALQ